MPRPLDDIDLLILARLQENGRLTRSRLAGIVGRSVPAVSARMRRLEDEGFIAGFHAAVDSRRLDHEVTAFSWVTLRSKRDERSFCEFASRRHEVLEVHTVTEAATQLLKLRTRSTTALQQVLDALEDWPGVLRISTSVVVATHKETRHLPVPRGGEVVRTGNGVGTARL